MSAAPDAERTEDLLTLEELAERVGVSARNVRFYGTRGLIPPSIRRGRMAYYSEDHAVRLGLLAELQAHGFTLSAIEGYLSRIPADAAPEEVALHRIMLQPWLVQQPARMSRQQIAEAVGREVDDEALAALRAVGVVRGQEPYEVTVGHLSTAVRLLDLGVPVEFLQETQAVYDAHGRAVAAELGELFRKKLWPYFREGGISIDQMLQLMEAFKPLSIASLVEAYSQAMTDAKRAEVERRSR